MIPRKLLEQVKEDQKRQRERIEKRDDYRRKLETKEKKIDE